MNNPLTRTNKERTASLQKSGDDAGQPRLDSSDRQLAQLIADCGKQHEIFGKSHIDEIALQYHLPVLARLPIDPSVAQKMDDGAAEQLPTADLQAAVETILQLG